MKIRYVSDLHLEICPFVLPYDEEDNDDSSILVLAGDIAVSAKFTDNMRRFFMNVSGRFKEVVYVPGNHEYYHGDITDAIQKLKDELSFLPNVKILDSEVHWIDDVAFVGATLWTDVNKRSEHAMQSIKNGLNDYHVVKANGYRELDPQDTAIIHDKHKKFIFDAVAQAKADNARKVIVISHHAPSHLSIHPKWAGSPLNPAFSSDLIVEIQNSSPDFWFHGHMHDNFKYNIGWTEVLCNPRGYSKVINTPDFYSIWIPACDGEKFKCDEYRYWNIFKQENVKFDPWASVDV
jgi:predicted phosphohydrolase